MSRKSATLEPYVALIDELAYSHSYNLKESSVGRQLLAASPEEQRGFVLAAIEWLKDASPKLAHEKGNIEKSLNLNPREVVQSAVLRILRRRLPLTNDDVNTLAEWCMRERDERTPQLIKILEDFIVVNKMTLSIQEKVEKLIMQFESDDVRFRDFLPAAAADARNWAVRLKELIGVPSLPALIEGDAWSDAALSDFENLEASEKSHWLELLNACAKASGSAPTAKWLKNAEALVNEIGFTQFRQAVLKWFPLVDKPRTQRIEQWSEYEPDPNNLIEPINADVLKGLVWLCAQKEDKEVARALTVLALSAYRKVPVIGPRCARVGNACVWALGEMPGTEGVGQLALLKVKVKTGAAQKVIAKALDTVAKRIGLPRDEIEEMEVPTYGLQEVGKRLEQLAGFTAELTITGTSTAELRWVKPDGKRQSSVPRAVKEQNAEALKELNQAVKDIRKMLPAQAARIENLYLEQKKWALSTWRERYLDHPLLGTLARRLIWKFTSGDRTASGIWRNWQMIGLDGLALDWLNDTTEVELWHPLYETSDGVMAWRELLTEHQVQQPFKQADREIYLLTEAERTTRVYSNRFAAHVLKQHQFNALCSGRDWKNKLRLMVDDIFPPAIRAMPSWGLRAEFWIEGIGDDYGTDTTEAGTFLYLSTDQVRFYRIDASQHSAYAGVGRYDIGARVADANDEPLALELVPPLVFSEIMRDVDLFVGVASVANDPTWADGGREPRYYDYWISYSFGDLSETAKTRRQVLERLIPRLKIADRCTLTDRFLVVRGDVRTYKIHLGSSNILIEPNNQYLCIVPGRSPASQGQTGQVFLPFEGDDTLSIILSKAFLLAQDWNIKDPTILAQIAIGSPDPDNTETYNDRGTVYSQTGEVALALADFDKALSLDPEYAKAYANRGMLYSEIGEFALALADLDKALSLDPNDALIFLNRGCLYIALGDLISALADFDKAIELDPNDAMAYSNRAATYSKLGQVQRAIADYGTAIQKNPSYANSYSNRAFAYYKVGEYEKGIADCERALALKPDDANTYCNRGHCYAALGNSERAASNFRQALELPGPPFVREEALNGLRSLGLDRER